MRKLIFVFIVLFTGVSNGNAQLLWKITGDGIKPSYIFGTHHLAPVSFCDSIDGFEEALNHSMILYGEIVAYDMQDMAKDMLPYMVLPADSLLDVIYNAGDYKILDNTLKQYFGVGAEQFKHLKPATIQSQLAILLYLKTFKEYNPDEILDAVIQRKAKEKGLIVKGLETLPYQAELLYGIPIQKQATDLMVAISDIDKFEEYSMRLCDAYMNQDLGVLLEIMEDVEFGSTGEDMERLVYDRNRKWVEQLKKVLPEYPIFIAVGAGHLPGDKGLINLLRKCGFKVTPV